MKSLTNRLARIAIAGGALLMLAGCYPAYYTHPGVVYDDGYSTGTYYSGYAPAYSYPAYPYYGYGYGYPYYGYGYGWPFALSIGWYGGYGGHYHGHGGHYYGGGGHGGHYGGGHPAPHH